MGEGGIAMTKKVVPSVKPSRFNPNWDKDPEILKEEIFAEWMKEHPDGTREQFEVQWGVVTAVFGI
jgi:hypothetical protein